MAEFKLHCFAESGNAYKVALYMEVCGLDWEPVYVDFFKGETRGAAYRSQVNLMGEVPVLEHKGKSLTQSGVILDYLSELTGQYHWNNGDERREIYRWMLFDNHKFTASIATLRYLIALMKKPENDTTIWLKGRIDGAMKVLENHLATNDFIACKRMTIADFSLCGYIFYGDELPFEITPGVQAWMQRIRALPHWKHPYDLMPRALKAD